MLQKRRLTRVFLPFLLILVFVIVGAFIQQPIGQETVDKKELRILKEKYPSCFMLDDSDGLTVLVCQIDREALSCLLIEGRSREVEAEAVNNPALSPEDAKKVLSYYALPEDRILLRPFRNPDSSYEVADMEIFRSRISAFFDNRYNWQRSRLFVISRRKGRIQDLMIYSPMT